MYFRTAMAMMNNAYHGRSWHMVEKLFQFGYGILLCTVAITNE